MKHQNDIATPTRLSLFAKSAAFGLAAFLLAGAQASAANYSGNGNLSFGGPIGTGVLGLTDDGTTISGTLSCNGHSLNDVLVIYIDTGAGGGFSSTAGFSDGGNGDGSRSAISGFNGGGTRSVMTFASGFNPQYAMAISSGFGGVWGLANGGVNSLPFKTSMGLLPLNNAGPYTFSFAATNIGLTPGVKTTINIFGTLISPSAYRSSEAIAGNDSGATGVNPFTQTAFASYTFDAGAPTLTPVTFQVDMSAMLTNGFNPGNNDTVNVTGSFVTVPGTLFQLTNDPNAANTNIYSGTYMDENPTNTAETFRYDWVSVSGNTTNTENSDSRPFTLLAAGVTNTLVYFSDLTPSPSATTNSVTFQVDMTSAITQGTFNPATQVVEAYGTFNQYYAPGNAVPVQWTTGMGQLTNNPLGANSNLYSFTFSDGNYPGSWEQYKFVVVTPSTATNYESIPNRDFVTPNGSTTLPLAYFNNVSNVVTVPVTFQVDMTSQAEAGLLSTNGTTVNVGIFDFGNPGGTLTNDPNAANTNIYSGTFTITAPQGASIGYKFEIVLNSVITYEQPASTDTGNRRFNLATNAQTLPLVFWNDADPNNDLPVATEVTFTVEVPTGVLDKNGVAFNPSTDAVLINGNFLPTGWNNALWTDVDPIDDFTHPSQQMIEVGLSDLYTNTFLVPGGNSLQVSYKYAIWHNTATPNTGSIDDEAASGTDHSRYIRAEGSYSMPTDLFGSLTNNPPTGNEISFGNLTASTAPGGQIALNWLGRPGVYLQMSTNLASQVWTTISNSGAGISASNFPSGGSNVFFRLVNP